MLNSLYSVASALESSTRNQELVAENLANSATPGYRRQGLVFEVSPYSMTAPPPSAGGSSPGGNAAPQVFSLFDSGPLEQTNNPLDLAVAGSAFFVLEGPNGPVYTRNGAFELTPTGELQGRGNGYRVSGQGGALAVPAGTNTIEVAQDGTIKVNGNNVIGRLQLATFAQPNDLRRVGPTLFEGDAPQTPPPGSARVQQGYREGSNVQVAQEMVSMMLGMRFYEAAERAMRAVGDAVAQNTRVQQ
ncbi:MAG: flagellar hook basal-body protein [Planctomycetes bacterium]|nr:flagellar hook basal-body protein [Planctomycetota bacterium]